MYCFSRNWTKPPSRLACERKRGLDNGGQAKKVIGRAVQTEHPVWRLACSCASGDLAGWEGAEIPIALVIKPFESDALWQTNWAQVQSWNLPPITVSSHFIQFHSLEATGPDVDWEQLAFWSERVFRRLDQVGVKAAGIYEGFFKELDGYPRSKAIDDAIRFVNLIAHDAEPYGIRIALEPQSDHDNLWPRYLEGLKFAREEINRPNVVRLMADIEYFQKLGQPFDDIGVEPYYCLNVHITGIKGQPGAGDDDAELTHLFRVLRDIGYSKTVTSACPWVPTYGTGKVNHGA
jgi:sugar phosphate isomerase/epimerase